MIKKHLSAIVTVLLAATLLLLSGCGRVTDALDQHFPEASATKQDTPLSDPLPDRVGRTYVILLTTELSTDDLLTTVSLLTFGTADGTVHWLDLPADLYVRTAGNTLAGSYHRAYLTELAEAGGTSVSAAAAGVSAVRSLLEAGFSITVDYSVNLDKDQFTTLMSTLNNVPVTLFGAAGGLRAGSYTLNAPKAISFLTYDGYNDPTEGQFEARRCFAAALRLQAVKEVQMDQLSLFTTKIRGAMTTDIPSAGGEDMFFLRRFLTASDDDFTITNISTQSVYSNGERYRVMVKGNALRQLNEQMKIYKKALTPEQFDPQGVFVDPSNPIMQSVYASSSVLPTLYTLTDLLNPKTDTEAGALPETETDPRSATEAEGAAD